MIPQFSVRLIVGLALMWGLLPRAQITSGFFRIQMLVTLGLSVLTALTRDQLDFQGTQTVPFGSTTIAAISMLLALISFTGSVLWTLERRKAGSAAGYLLLGMAGLLLLGIPSAVNPEQNAISTAHAFASAAILGSMTGAMLLGHWYLTATSMSLAPLWRAVTVAGCAVGVRTLMSVHAFALIGAAGFGNLWSELQVWVLLRILAGLAGPALLVILVRGALKYRNTQSATGILFAAVILTFIGEAAALLIAEESRLLL